VDELGVKQAVDTAKRYISDLFADEGVVNLGLEEIDYDEARLVWRITLGFSRVRDLSGRELNHMFATARRDYKVVTIDNSGRVLSVKNRESSYAG
jgi:hypothetical protein